MYTHKHGNSIYYRITAKFELVTGRPEPSITSVGTAVVGGSNPVALLFSHTAKLLELGEQPSSA